MQALALYTSVGPPNPDLVLFDMVMQVMDGVAVARALRPWLPMG